jgi:trigger factor
MEEEEIDSLIRQQMQRWQLDARGRTKYLKSVRRTPEQLREELRPVAVRSIKQSLVLTEVAKLEKIQIDKADLEGEIASMTQDVPDERKEKLMDFLTMPQTQVNIASSIATRRTIEKLTEIAKSPAETVNQTENVEAKVEESRRSGS